MSCPDQKRTYSRWDQTTKRMHETSNNAGDSKRGRYDDNQDLYGENNEKYNQGSEEVSDQSSIEQLEYEVKISNDIIQKLKMSLQHLIADNNMLAGQGAFKNEGEEEENEDLNVKCYERLHNRIAELEFENLKLNVAGQVKDNTIASLKRINEELTNRITEKTEKEKSDKIEAQNVESLKTENANLKHKCDRLNVKFERITLENEKKLLAMEELKSKLNSTKNKLHTAKFQINVIETLQPLNNEFETKIEKLETENKSLEATLQKLREAFAEIDKIMRNPIQTNNIKHKVENKVEVDEKMEDKVENEDKVEIYSKSGVFCAKNVWMELQNATTVSCFCKNLFDSLFSKDELATSSFKGTKSDFKYNRPPLDQVKVSAFCSCVTEKFPMYSEPEIATWATKHLYNVRRSVKRSKVAQFLHNSRFQL